MTFTATRKIQNLVRERVKTPQIILEIDGIPFIFGALPVEVDWFFDETPPREFDTTGLRFDAPIQAINSVDVISLDKTTKTFGQQVIPDKSGTSSIATMTIELVDKNEQVSEILNFKNYVNDILGRRATVYTSLKGDTSHPEDSLPVLQGFIDDYQVIQGSYLISVSHPGNLVRREFFVEYKSKITSGISASATTLNVLNTDNLVLSQDALTSYVRVDDEIMRVNSKGSSTINVTRGQLGSSATTHDSGADVSSNYRLVGDPIDIALKIYLSGSSNTTFGSYSVESFVSIGGGGLVPGAIVFSGINIKQQSGISIGDTINITGSSSNNGSYTIVDIVPSYEYGSYLIVDDPLTTEINSNGSCTFSSQFNTLPIGLGLTNNEIDVDQHLAIQNENPATFSNIDLLLTEQIEGKEVIDRKIYYPQSLYSIPRNAKVSAKLVQPPLNTNNIVRLNETSLTNVENIKVSRSTSKFFYNSIVYKFGKDRVFDKFTRGEIFINETSNNRIPVGAKQLTIEADSLPDNGNTENLVRRQSLRQLDRYKFGAQRITNVKPMYDQTYNLDVGDVVIFGSTGLKLTDLNTGKRQFEERLVEVVNKQVNLTNGEISLELLETAYDLNARFGVISPSSIVGSGSTTTEIKLNLSYSSSVVYNYEYETEKWADYIGERLRVFNSTYSYDEVVTITGIKSTNRNFLIVSPALPSAPSSGYNIEIPEYEANEDLLYKSLFTYFNPQINITTSVSTTQFRCSTSFLFVGAVIYVSSPTYNRDSFEVEDVEITNISGTLVTVNKSLGFTPQVGDHVELVGFVSDEGAAYRIY